MTSLPSNGLMSIQVPFNTSFICSRDIGSSFRNIDSPQVIAFQKLIDSKAGILIETMDASSLQTEENFSIAQDFPGSKTFRQLSAFPAENKSPDDRLSVVVDMIINEDGALQNSIVYKMRLPDDALVEYDQIITPSENDG